ncbi:anhydro-N-acetylmuramic acid kinase [Roseicitreum antarcticum]|uniref:Anhydro-N-acetylmuramic acid kinase n=1 Tax=Roseicitreum antarcticum TaxID=564137 RepID=A0A1H2ZYB9_9RHOB|nr:anhydro-N-acetylmuramic acid kinase [Roseicitreum antarcticum]SDX22397.1 anhydro-N-acetylmuramic acid kinase [Roseicitreum antarcticum]
MLKAGVKTGMLRVLGTMSGTSLDGVDAAVLETDGDVIRRFGPSAYRPYTDAERAVLRTALGRWPGDAGVEEAAEVVETAHAEVMNGFEAIDLAGFHGQTLAHDPGARRTHQTGSGAVLAEVLGWPVVWDFRSNDVELGGQGAPLAPFYHHALARHLGLHAPVVFLNLGGVGNVTWVDPRLRTPDTPGACLAFDTGPACGPLNDLMQARRGVPMDADGALAASGIVDQGVVDRYLSGAYFHKIPPKSLDRLDPGLMAAVADLGDADACATLSAVVAAAVARAAEHYPDAPARMLVSGGGRHNPVLMAMIRAAVPCDVSPVEALGLDGDMIEAQAFAYLAVRVLRGLPTSAPGTTGVAAAVGGGRVSQPG